MLIVLLLLSTSVLARDDVCFGSLGCFSMRSPWRTFLRSLPAPDSPEKIKTHFLLYTRKNPEKEYLVSPWPNFALEKSKYDITKPNIFITHGFASSGRTSWVKDLVLALLNKVNANVFVTDWSAGASRFTYVQPAANTRVVGAEMARFIQFLIENGSDESKFHLIGHSLGAHICAYAAKNFGTLARITALDPAQPFFETFNREVRLDASDAKFVEAIHTDAKPFVPFFGFGMMSTVGHVDYYINDGWSQPGCIIPKKLPNITSVTDLFRIPLEVVKNLVQCAHGRAYEVYTAALNNKYCKLWGQPFDSVSAAISAASLGWGRRLTTPSIDTCTESTCTVLRYDVPSPRARGVFTVSTISREPYCMEMCYEELGCFSLTDPWTSFTRPVPAPDTPKRIGTTFYHYNSVNSTRRFEVVTRPNIKLNGEYNGSRPTIFITHGYIEDGTTTWMADMKEAFLNRLDANVFLVDWGKGSFRLNYLQAVTNTRIVGAEIARFIHFLIKEKGASASLMHLIGHSLGSHIAAYAAKNVTGVGRITALDPAQPGFEGYDAAVRLFKDDASFVEVIHSDAKPFIPFFGFGMMDAVGHVDFYINGGYNQPGCTIPDIRPIKSIGDLALFPIEFLAKVVACPHARAHQVYTSSINNPHCRFWGHRTTTLDKLIGAVTRGFASQFLIPSDDDCTIASCSPIGYDTINYPARDTFTVFTTGGHPFCVLERKVDQAMKSALGSYLNPSFLENIVDNLKSPKKLKIDSGIKEAIGKSFKKIKESPYSLFGK